MRAPLRITLSIVAAIASVFALQPAHAQGGAGRGKPDAGKGGMNETVRAAADALGMLRGPARVDAINTMEFWGSGTSMMGGQSYKTDYHVSLGYDPAGMRIEMTRVGANGGAPQHTLQVVNAKYAWDETEVGSGLDGGKGTATATPSALNDRLLQLWAFPFGAIKSAIAAGDKTKVTTEGGMQVITFPLSGPLAGVTEKVSLDPKNNLPAKIEIHSDKPMPNMITEIDYSNYADLGDITSDVQFPGHIVQKTGDKTVLDITVKMDDPNNPFLIFPAPDSVLK